MFEIDKDHAGDFRFYLKAKNGEIILTSEGFKQKTNCESGIESARYNAQDENNFYFKKTKDDQWFFILKANNGMIMGTSEMFDSEINAQKGANTVKRQSEEALLIEAEN